MKRKYIVTSICLFVVFTTLQIHAQEPLHPITLQLNWIPNVQFAGILLAKDQGWYDKAGIDLKIEAWKFGISATDEVAAGRAQIGIAEGDALIKARASGQALKAIGVQFQKSAFCLISKKERGITTPEQLVDTFVGLNSPESELMTKIVLRSQGLKYEDIFPVQVGWELDPLIHDEIDVLAAFINNDPLNMRDQGYEVNVIPAFEYGYDFYSGVYFTTDTMIRQQPELIRAFLDVTWRGWRAAFADPAAAAQLVVEKYFTEGSASQQTEDRARHTTL